MLESWRNPVRKALPALLPHRASQWCSPRSKPYPLPVSKCFKAVFYISTILFQRMVGGDLKNSLAPSPEQVHFPLESVLASCLSKYSKQPSLSTKGQEALLKIESAGDRRVCCARTLSLISVKMHKSVLARRSEVTAQEYPCMLFLAED